jgi:hypothetical protein
MRELLTSSLLARPKLGTSSWGKVGLKARFSAAAIHFLVSALAALLITLPIVFWLYPSPFFEAAGGMHLLGIILGIDVILGPTLTFLIFNKAKASLKMDLKIIAGIQIAALSYGLYATAASRPVYMTYVVDRFEMVSAADVDEDELLKAPKEIQTVKWGHPQLAYAQQPASEEERSSIMFSSLNGVDLNRLFRYYKLFALAKPQIVERAQQVSELSKWNTQSTVDIAVEPYKNQPLAFVPLQGKKRDLTVLVNAKTGDLIKVVDLRPWSEKN